MTDAPEPTAPTDERAELIAYLKKYRNALNEITVWAAAELGIAHPLVTRIAGYLNDLSGPGNPLSPIEFQEYLERKIRERSFADYYRWSAYAAPLRPPPPPYVFGPPGT
jgi:hypothetical protein